MGRDLAARAALVGALLLAVCTSTATPARPNSTVAAIDLSLPALPGSCAPRGVVPGSEVEPALAISPADRTFLVATWQQDRHPQGAAGAIAVSVSRDGGKTWNGTLLPGTTACTQGAFTRVSDPTVGIGADGTAYVAALFNRPGLNWPGGFAVSASRDRGATWGSPVPVLDLADRLQVVDKPTLTADPRRPGAAYAAWVQYKLDRPESPPRRNTFYFARTGDGGATWSRPLAVYGADSENQFHQLLVLADESLLDVFVEAHELPADQPGTAADVTVRMRAVRSPDQGATWSAPIDVASFPWTAAASPVDGHPIRATAAHIAATAGPDGGIFAVFQEHHPKASSSLDLVHSPDGGRTWETPVRVVTFAGEVMLPSLATDAAGTAALVWYEVSGTPGSKALTTTAWAATLRKGSPVWERQPVLGPFDLARAVDSGGYFLGDYAGLVGTPAGFAAALPVSRAGGPAGASAIEFVTFSERR